MRRNMGGLDRVIRAVVLAPAAVVAAILLGPASGWGIALWAIAGVMLLSASVGFCLLYVPLGIDTRSRTQRARAQQAPTSLQERLEPKAEMTGTGHKQGQ